MRNIIVAIEQVESAIGVPAITVLIISAIIAPSWMAWWNSRIARKEVRPNGGSSMRDEMRLISTDVMLIKDVTNHHGVQIDMIHKAQVERGKLLEEVLENQSTIMNNQTKTRQTILTEREST